MKTTKTIAVYGLAAAALLGSLENVARADKEVDLSVGRCSGCGWKACICWNGTRKVGKPNSKSIHWMHTGRGRAISQVADIMEENIAGRSHSGRRRSTVNSRRDVLRHEIDLAFERGDFGLAFELLNELDPRLGRPPVRR